MEDDLLGLGQHDEAQGAHCFWGDVCGGLPVQRRQNRVLDVAKGSAGQLHGVEKIVKRDSMNKKIKNKSKNKETIVFAPLGKQNNSFHCRFHQLLVLFGSFD